MKTDEVTEGWPFGESESITCHDLDLGVGVVRLWMDLREPRTVAFEEMK
jgi:hypothetical protein